MSQLRDLDQPPVAPPHTLEVRHRRGKWESREVPYRPRPRRERKQRTWTHKLLGMLAMYGFFSLVLHAVVAWELTH